MDFFICTRGNADRAADEDGNQWRSVALKKKYKLFKNVFMEMMDSLVTHQIQGVETVHFLPVGTICREREHIGDDAFGRHEGS